MAEYLTEDFAYIDVSGHRMNSREEFLRVDCDFRKAIGNPQAEIETLDHHGDETLVRGQLSRGSDEVGGQTFWRIYFDDDRIQRVDVTRAGRHKTLPVFPARAKV